MAKKLEQPYKLSSVSEDEDKWLRVESEESKIFKKKTSSSKK